MMGEYASQARLRKALEIIIFLKAVKKSEFMQRRLSRCPNHPAEMSEPPCRNVRTALSKCPKNLSNPLI
jgi:hypothetical protein